MMRTIYLFLVFNSFFQQPNRISLWSRKIRKSVWMASHRSSAVLRATRHHPCSGRKKVRKCSCFRTTRTVTFTWRVKERCKFVAFRRRTPAILCARHWVWLVRRRYVLSFKWHPSTIFRRQSYKSARPIKRCPREVSRCCRVVRLERRRHAFAGTRTACRCRRDIDWLLCRVDHWKSTVSHSGSDDSRWCSSSSCSGNQIIIFAVFLVSRFTIGRYGTLYVHSIVGEWRNIVVSIAYGKLLPWCSRRFFPFSFIEFWCEKLFTFCIMITKNFFNLF